MLSSERISASKSIQYVTDSLLDVYIHSIYILPHLAYLKLNADPRLPVRRQLLGEGMALGPRLLSLVIVVLGMGACVICVAFSLKKLSDKS